MELLFVAVVLVIVVFAFMNGFHDAAITVGNAVVHRALTPRLALALAAVFNFIGALLGQSIAEVVVANIVDFPPDQVDVLLIVLAGVLGGLVWNLVTYLFALPVSSTHCLFGGLIGAGLVFGATSSGRELFVSVLAPLILTPLVAFLLSFLLMGVVSAVAGATAMKPLFRRSRMVSSVLTGALSLAHGTQDAQKSAAIMMVAVLACTTTEPVVLDAFSIDWPVRITIACALALGTLLSGWRVARTLSVRMVQLDPVKSAVSDFTSTSFMFIAALLLRVPVSMSFLVVAANLGTQFEDRRAGVRMRYLVPVLGSWLLSLPAAAVLAALLALVLLPAR